MGNYYISADLEGIHGVASWLHLSPTSGDLVGYTKAVTQLAAEVNAVAEAMVAHDASATIVVNDAHGHMTNLMRTDMSPRVRLLSGKPKPCAMMTGLDSTFDAACLIGYHAKAGTEKGTLNHTFHDQLFDVSINGVSYGEGGINALYAGLVHQVPVVLASGDDQFATEIHQLMPNLTVVQTKKGVSTTAALFREREDLMEAYRVKTLEALRTSVSPLTLPGPYTARVTFINSTACDVVALSPLYQRVDGRTIEFRSDDFETIYLGIQSAYTMLAYTDYLAGSC